MAMWLKSIFFVGLMMCLNVGQAKAQQLDRNTALVLIEMSADASQFRSRIPAVAGYLQAGEEQGLWSLAGGRTIYAPTAAQIAKIEDFNIYPVRPVTLSVKVTGVVQDTNSKMARVDFGWSYVSLPMYIKRFAKCGGTGSAMFIKFDDGWRADRIRFVVADAGCVLTADEIRRRNDDLSKNKVKKQSISARIEESYALLPAVKSYSGNYYGVNFRYDITPNGVAYYKPAMINGRRSGPLMLQHFAWYGKMFNLKEHAFGVAYTASPSAYSQARFFTTRQEKLDTQEFLKQVLNANTEWNKKYSSIPQNMRDLYIQNVEAQAMRKKP